MKLCKKIPKIFVCWYFITIFALETSVKVPAIMNATIINRETTNGTKWQIVASNFGAALYINNVDKPGYHYSGYYFGSIEEAQAHLDAVDDRVKTPVKFTACEVPADYYRDCNRYFGD